MNTFRTVLSGLDLARLNGAVDAMNEELTHLPSQSFPNITQTPLTALGEAWRHLVESLVLSPGTQVRICPVCQQFCLVDATLCEHCWSPLPTVDRPEANA